MRVYDITDFGAVGKPGVDNAIAIQKAINECHLNGGGIVKVPGGQEFMTGPFQLKSFINLHIESGAKILANPDESKYTTSAFRENFGEGSIWIGGENAEKVSITGQGVIDGNGVAFMGMEKKAAYELKPFDVIDPRPHVFTPIKFTNLTIKDVTFTNAAYWCIHLVGCNDVTIHDVRILNNLKIRNSDGIDIDHSRNVRISDCDIESGDDCICFKTRREYAEMGPTENVTITNCIMKSTSCSVKLGSENMDAIRNVVISNCIINGSNRGFGIQNRDEGIVENIIVENMIIESRLFDDVWWGKAEPISITSYKRASTNEKDGSLRFAKGQKMGEVGIVSNVFFSNILCNSENGVFIGGEPGKVKNITFTNVMVEIEEKTDYSCGAYDLRPSTEGILEAITSGFYFKNVKGLKLINSDLKWGERKCNKFGSAVFAQNCEDLTFINFNGKAAFPHIDDSIIIPPVDY
jgi:polygalacturonase